MPGLFGRALHLRLLVAKCFTCAMYMAGSIECRSGSSVHLETYTDTTVRRERCRSITVLVCLYMAMRGTLFLTFVFCAAGSHCSACKHECTSTNKNLVTDLIQCRRVYDRSVPVRPRCGLLRKLQSQGACCTAQQPVAQQCVKRRAYSQAKDHMTLHSAAAGR